MKNILIAFVFALLPFCSFAQVTPAKAAEVPLIDRSLFFDNPEIAGGQLSPDGQYVSFLKAHNGILNIWVKKFDEPFEKARRLTNLERPADSYFWTYDSKYILYQKDKGGNENFNIYAVRPSASNGKDGIPESRNLTPNDKVRALIYTVSQKNPDLLMIGMNDRDPQWHDLYQLQISTGQLKKLRENKDRVNNWVFDWDENLRLAVRTAEDGSTELLRVDGNELKKIYESGPLESTDPLSFTPDNRQLYMRTNKGDTVNLEKLVLLDPMTGMIRDVERDPLGRVDLEGARFSDSTHELLATTYYDTKPRRYIKDQAWAKDYQLLQAKFPGQEIDIPSVTRDERKALIVVYSDVNPGEIYFFNRDNKTIVHQYTPRPKLKPYEKYFSTMQAITYKSSDGMEIPAYLTLPAGGAKTNLPLLVIPHGGPWSRDQWGYGSWVQWMANRGFAVLQPNFRGSTGYGKAFLNAGNLQWGRLMQDDITWGVKALITQGVVDPKRVAIMGGSYGGYATLAGLTYTPDLYTCGVDYVGPSNLITLLKTIPPYWASFLQQFTLRMGDAGTDAGMEILKAASPYFNADKIKAPLLIVQGANDPRVNKAESDQIVVALRDRGMAVQYICAPDEGHGFRKPVNRMAAFAASEQFLAKYCGTRYQEDMPADVAARLKAMTVDIKTVKIDKAAK